MAIAYLVLWHLDHLIWNWLVVDVPKIVRSQRQVKRGVSLEPELCRIVFLIFPNVCEPDQRHRKCNSAPQHRLHLAEVFARSCILVPTAHPAEWPAMRRDHSDRQRQAFAAYCKYLALWPYAISHGRRSYFLRPLFSAVNSIRTRLTTQHIALILLW